jgi:hypothetical protein
VALNPPRKIVTNNKAKKQQHGNKYTKRRTESKNPIRSTRKEGNATLLGVLITSKKEGVCIIHGSERKRCSFEEGCTNNIALKGCVTHAANEKRKRCSFKGCTNFAQKGGVCITHGAKVKQCSFKGCTKHAKRGGVCVTHGAKRKQCSFKGCANQVQKGGVCITHGAKRKQCSFKGCINQAKKGGVCVTHGAKVMHKRCSHEGCTNGAVKGGVCITHGAIQKHKRCSFKGCTYGVIKGGVCITHGAKKPLCSFKGCTNQVVLGGICTTHGAKRKRCSFMGCINIVQQGGVCTTHGAKRKRCSHEGCTNGAVKGGVCITHGKKVKFVTVDNDNDDDNGDDDVNDNNGINEAIKAFQSQKNPTGTDWTLLVAKLAPRAVDDVEAVGYMIRKEFSSGWFRGIVGHIHKNAAGGKTRRVYYEDGDMEDLSLMQLKSLPPDTHTTQREPPRGVHTKLNRNELVTTCIAANANNPTPQLNTDVIPATPSSQFNNYEDEEELNSWIWRSSRVQWPRSTTNTN